MATITNGSTMIGTAAERVALSPLPPAGTRFIESDTKNEFYVTVSGGVKAWRAYRQQGTATLSGGGTVTVSGVTLTAASVIMVAYNTAKDATSLSAGVQAPSASRNVGAGTFVISNGIGGDATSTVDWAILG